MVTLIREHKLRPHQDHGLSPQEGRTPWRETMDSDPLIEFGGVRLADGVVKRDVRKPRPAAVA